jgi:hypothetical protein
VVMGQFDRLGMAGATMSRQGNLTYC